MSRFEIAPGALRSYHWGRNDQRGAEKFFANWLYQGDKGTSLDDHGMAKWGWKGWWWNVIWLESCVERVIENQILICMNIMCVYSIQYAGIYYILQLEPTANLLKLPYFKGVFVSFIVEHTTYSNTSSLTQKYGWNPKANPKRSKISDGVVNGFFRFW